MRRSSCRSLAAAAVAMCVAAGCSDQLTEPDAIEAAPAAAGLQAAVQEVQAHWLMHITDPARRAEVADELVQQHGADVHAQIDRAVAAGAEDAALLAAIGLILSTPRNQETSR